MIDYKPGNREIRSLDSDWNPLGGEIVFHEDDLLNLLDNAGTVSCWDYNTSLGDTIREKYETLAYKIIEVAKVISHKITKPEFFWAALPSQLAVAVEIGLDRTTIPDYIPMGGKDPRFIGTLMNRVKMYDCPCLPENKILIGCGTEPKDSSHYAKISVCNFVV
jgi:hypothetical protein